MRMLVLGGTHFVGRALVETLLAAGDSVTTLTSGRSGPPAPGADARYADRRDPDALAAALGEDAWDAAVDTWSAEPAVVQATVRVLRGRVGHWTYVSSCSVYRDATPGMDESAGTFEADPGSTDTFYPRAKRGGELASLGLDVPVFLPRPGLILGPYEGIGRLPFWLDRISRSARLPAPGPRDRRIQFVDARDLALLVRRCAVAGTGGVANVVSRRGERTMGELLEACRAVTGSDTELVWLSPEVVADAGVEPWTELPCWLPPGHEDAGVHETSTEVAEGLGLTCRPTYQTVADTWAWLGAEGMPVPSARGRQGFDAAAEQRLWAAYAGST